MTAIIPERSKFASKVTTDENFWARVDKSGDCWLWTGHRDENGYGRVGYQCRPSIGAHRVAWALTHGGEIPTEWVLHRCDNPPCVKPDHMFLGDATDNNQDRQAKGRTKGWAGRKGAAHHAYKVTPELADRMRTMRAEGMTQQSISDLTGISRGQVAKTVSGILPRYQKGKK